jgi:arylsulfatase A-like enzyme
MWCSFGAVRLRLTVSIFLALLYCLPAQAESDQSAQTVKRPNILLILADDLGYTDLQPYGSEVSTPNLQALAERGVRFTNYHTAANCAPSRAMLLTGVSNHLAGVPNIPEMLAPEQKEQDNYQGVLGDNVVTVATLLEDAGYHTYMAGKWHLGKTPNKLPSRRGFERTVAMADSGADHWEQRPYIPIYDKANWFADGEEHTLPEDFYSSTYLVDKTIEFIGSNLSERDSTENKPFFAYLPFMAVHIPVQAPQKYIDRYMGTYDSGWDDLREQRAKNATNIGIIPADTPMVRMSDTEDWDALSDERRRFEAKRMAVYAAMIESMDTELGRLFTYLEQNGELDNTIIIFTSDNGSEASGPRDGTSFAASFGPSRMGYHLDYDTLGLKGSYNTISPYFASASVSPLAYFKFYAGEGGMRVPLIVAGMDDLQEGSLNQSFTWATDITPTILSLAEVDRPGARYAGRPIEPISGKDLTPLLTGAVDRVRASHEAVGYELTGHAALFQGDYKIVANQAPLGDGEWRLFNIVTDPGETEDLRSIMPEQFQKMLSEYEQFKVDNRVAPLPRGYTQMKQLLANILQASGKNFVIFILALLVLIPFLVAWKMRKA